MGKKEIRERIKTIKQQKGSKFIQETSVAVLQNVEKLDLFSKAKHVLCYWAMNDEVQTQAFIEKWYKKKQIYLPCVEGDTLKIRKFDGAKSMKPGQLYDIPEPIGKELIELSVLEMIIVPGVAFDIFGNRMGRGKGYYDKLLTQSCAEKVGVCFDFQLMEQIPIETHDIPMNELVTESEIFLLC